jgi:hypothetical protein
LKGEQFPYEIGVFFLLFYMKRAGMMGGEILVYQRRPLRICQILHPGANFAGPIVETLSRQF